MDPVLIVSRSAGDTVVVTAPVAEKLLLNWSVLPAIATKPRRMRQSQLRSVCVSLRHAVVPDYSPTFPVARMLCAAFAGICIPRTRIWHLGLAMNPQSEGDTELVIQGKVRSIDSARTRCASRISGYPMLFAFVG